MNAAFVEYLETIAALTGSPFLLGSLAARVRKQTGCKAGVFIDRGTTAWITDNGRSRREPEPLAHKLPVLAITVALPAMLR
ncbi:MAG: hypothetical protein ACOX52_23100 [Verrucomicrobiota bacterium]